MDRRWRARRRRREWWRGRRDRERRRDADEPLAGSALDRASSAGLEHTGGGTVIETEAGDDGTAYGVEVRLPDGRVVEVTLDERFTVVDQQADDDASNASEQNDTEGG